MPFWLGIKFDEEVPKQTRRLCLRYKPEKCPECSSKEMFLVYERFAVEGNVKREAYWICENCKRKFGYVPLKDY
jgi:transposase-like protein